MSFVPTHIYPRFDGTQTRLGPLKLGATYLVNSLVWIAGCFAIAANEVPLPSCYRHKLTGLIYGLKAED